MKMFSWHPQVKQTEPKPTESRSEFIKRCASLTGPRYREMIVEEELSQVLQALLEAEMLHKTQKTLFGKKLTLREQQVFAWGRVMGLTEGEGLILKHLKWGSK